ncbi:uncharacterized protein LOC110825307 isoform X4 [Carica papaya]|uniref:uncharacterized protein LOC110825307 isoform X4 n=1 Tax=Carica papaya TaxID=3649 RepID=UPI000B8C83F4|nr:uncharacterized protein LOC110825307 isoform X4 [Carica papaya]
MILRQWFERVDSQKTGSITATKLKHYCRMYDLDPNGTMSFEGFVELSKFLLKGWENVVIFYMWCILHLGLTDLLFLIQFHDAIEV